MAGKEFGVVRKRLNQAEAAPYIGIARKFLGMLKEQMGFQGLQQLAWHDIPIAPGVTCSVRSVHGQDVIQIDATPLEEEQRGHCVLRVYSGLVEARYQVNDIAWYDRYAASPVSQGLLKVGSNWLYNEGRHAVAGPGGWYLVPGEPLDQAPLFDRSHNADSFYDKLPGRYSGEMRKVVQLILGRGKTPGFQYGFYFCHGIWTGSDGSKWIVEIGWYGVWAQRLYTCDAESVYKKAGLTYVPQTTEFDYSKAYLVADYGQIAQFYDRLFPLWMACGWAFSASGNQAANIGYYPDENGLYLHAESWRMSITGNKQPETIVLNKVDDGWFWGLNTTHCKFPSYSLPGDPTPSCLVSFGWTTTPAPPESSFRCPVHVFFRDETLKTCYHVWDNGESYLANTNSEVCRTVAPGYLDPECLANPPNKAGWGYHSGTEGITNCFDTPIMAKKEGYSTTSGTMTEFEVVPGPGSGYFAPYVYLACPICEGYQVNPSGSNQASSEFDFIHRATDYTGSKSLSVTDIFIVPMNDRDGYYHYRSEYKVISFTSHEEANNFISYGKYIIFPQSSFLSWCLGPPDARQAAYCKEADCSRIVSDPCGAGEVVAWNDWGPHDGFALDCGGTTYSQPSVKATTVSAPGLFNSPAPGTKTVWKVTIKVDSARMVGLVLYSGDKETAPAWAATDDWGRWADPLENPQVLPVAHDELGSACILTRSPGFGIVDNLQSAGGAVRYPWEDLQTIWFTYVGLPDDAVTQE